MNQQNSSKSKSLFKRLAALSTIIIALVIIFFKPDGQKKQVVPMTDLYQHPLYSAYDFKPDNQTIYFGTQPLYVPTGIITAVMKRDSILVEQLAELNKNIVFYPFLKGGDINFFLGEKKLDAGVAGDMPVISAGANFETANTLIMQYGFSSIVAKKPSLTSELKGKKIGFPFGSISHYSLLKTLSLEGITEKQVKLIPMEITELTDALQSGKIYAFSAWEPTPTLALKKNAQFSILSKNISYGYLYFRGKTVDNNLNERRIIIAAAIRAINWLKNSDDNFFVGCEWNLGECKKIAAPDTLLNSRVLTKLAMQDVLGLVSLMLTNDDDLLPGGHFHREFSFLQAQGVIPSEIQWEMIKNCFDDALVHEILNDYNTNKIDQFRYRMED